MLFHSSTANRSKNIAQCFVSVLLCLTILFNSITVAHAGTIGGWTYSNPISKGASAVISATKNVVINGKDFIKSGSATITPTAAQVAKTFGKTAGALALSVAIEQILGTVDWVLDPENNQITYIDNSAGTVCKTTKDCAYYKKLYIASYSDKAPLDQYPISYTFSFTSAQCFTAISLIYAPEYATKAKFDGTRCISDSPYGSFKANIYYIDNPDYSPTATQPTNNKKSYPLSNISQRVIDNAKTGEPKAQAAILQTATDILAEAETDSTKARPITNQLEQSAETKPADAVDALKQNTGTAKTTNPDGSVAESEFEMPVACTWMPTICEAASVVTHQTKVWAQDIADYFKEEPQEQEDNTVDIDQSIPEINNKPRVSIGTDQCPSVPMNFDLGIVSIPIDLSPVWLCEIAQGVKPFFIALGFYFASNIVGRRQQ